MDEEPLDQEGIHQWLDHSQFPPHLKKYVTSAIA